MSRHPNWSANSDQDQLTKAEGSKNNSMSRFDLFPVDAGRFSCLILAVFRFTETPQTA
jgi:hypothetical protein